MYIFRVLSLHPVWFRSSTLLCCPVKWSLWSASKNKAFVLWRGWEESNICDQKNTMKYHFYNECFSVMIFWNQKGKTEFQKLCPNRSFISNRIGYFLQSIKSKQWNFFLNINEVRICCVPKCMHLNINVKTWYAYFQVAEKKLMEFYFMHQFDLSLYTPVHHNTMLFM